MTGKKKWPTLAMSQKSRQASLQVLRKSGFNGKDFGVISIDTAAKDPNVA